MGQKQEQELEQGVGIVTSIGMAAVVCSRWGRRFRSPVDTS